MERDWEDIERHLSQCVPQSDAQAVSHYVQTLAADRFYMETNIKSCRRCPLAEQCYQPVPGFGSWTADIMLIGEAPAAQEERYDVPFVGVTGQLLTLMLMKLGVDRRRIYTTNVVKCRLPGDRSPTMEEIRVCSQAHLMNEIRIVQPRVILTLGNPAMWALRPEGNSLRITKERGVWREWHGIPMMHTYHPSYVMRKRGEDFWKAAEEMYSDLSNVVSYAIHQTMPQTALAGA